MGEAKPVSIRTEINNDDNVDYAIIDPIKTKLMETTTTEQA